MNTDKNGDLIFSIGTFAKICQTTRDTLYHYEQTGLIVPQINSENHYRFYTAEDFFRYEYIHHLRRIGFTLAQIKECLTKRNIDTYLHISSESQEICMNKIRELQIQYARMDALRKDTYNTLQLVLNSPEVVYLDETYYAASPFCGNFLEQEGLGSLSGHFTQESIAHLASRHAPIFRISKDRFQQANYIPESIMTPADVNHPGPLHYRPGGNYLQMTVNATLFSLDPDDHHMDQYIEKFKQYISENNYTILSDLYCVDLIGPFLTDNPKDYRSALSICIES